MSERESGLLECLGIGTFVLLGEFGFIEVTRKGNIIRRVSRVKRYGYSRLTDPHNIQQETLLGASKHLHRGS